MYVVIPCLSPDMQHKTENIFTIALYKSSDQKVVSLKQIFKKVVEELHFLEEEG